MVYGDELSKVKDTASLLCVFANINGLPRLVKQPKERMIRKLITDYDVDIAGLTEINLN